MHLIKETASFGKRPVMMLSEYKHENIISLLGFCDEEGRKILIYKYASKKSLDAHLDNKELEWAQRLKICIGAAQGLAYIHDPTGSQQRLLHRDIKSSKILLDENWNAIVSGFGLSRFGPANQKNTSIIIDNVVGTVGYVDPEYMESGILTKESDIYSFGVVLFEVLCGRLCIVSIQRPSLAMMIRRHIRRHKLENLEDIVWSNIKDDIHPESLKKFSAIAYKCLERDHEDRPELEEIIEVLKHCLKIQLTLNTNSSLVKMFQHFKINLASIVLANVLKPGSTRPVQPVEPGPGGKTGLTYTGFMPNLSSDQPGWVLSTRRSNRSQKTVATRSENKSPITCCLIRKIATNNFSSEHSIGKGGFGEVFEGNLTTSKGITKVAIKRLDRSFGQGDFEFWKEIMMLSEYKHGNIISLLGFCDEKNEKILVYEHASKKSLDLHLDNKELTWVRRLEISIGAAQGLAYLHNPAGTQQRLLHRDIKSWYTKSDNINEIVWCNKKNEVHPDSLRVYSQMAYKCLKRDQGKRPKMEEVVRELETCLRYQEFEVKAQEATSTQSTLEDTEEIYPLGESN
ncbi:hypothetical protein LXL04_033279 [Taraxacum kok-saghyz]